MSSSTRWTLVNEIAQVITATELEEEVLDWKAQRKTQKRFQVRSLRSILEQKFIPPLDRRAIDSLWKIYTHRSQRQFDFDRLLRDLDQVEEVENENEKPKSGKRVVVGQKKPLGKTAHSSRGKSTSGDFRTHPAFEHERDMKAAIQTKLKKGLGRGASSISDYLLQYDRLDCGYVPKSDFEHMLQQELVEPLTSAELNFLCPLLENKSSLINHSQQPELEYDQLARVLGTSLSDLEEDVVVSGMSMIIPDANTTNNRHNTITTQSHPDVVVSREILELEQVLARGIQEDGEELYHLLLAQEQEQQRHQSEFRTPHDFYSAFRRWAQQPHFLRLLRKDPKRLCLMILAKFPRDARYPTKIRLADFFHRYRVNVLQYHVPHKCRAYLEKHHGSSSVLQSRFIRAQQQQPAFSQSCVQEGREMVEWTWFLHVMQETLGCLTSEAKWILESVGMTPVMLESRPAYVDVETFCHRFVQHYSSSSTSSFSSSTNSTRESSKKNRRINKESVAMDDCKPVLQEQQQQSSSVWKTWLEQYGTDSEAQAFHQFCQALEPFYSNASHHMMEEDHQSPSTIQFQLEERKNKKVQQQPSSRIQVCISFQLQQEKASSQS